MSKLVLKASAGTGKTYRLSLEYIISLLNGVAYNEILVMTFTRKATSEIKENIFKRIEEILYGDEATKNNIKEVIKKINPDISFNNSDIAKLENEYLKMYKNREKVMIYTIDSFTGQIFNKLVLPILNINTYQMLNQKQNDEYIEVLLTKILSNEKIFFEFSDFLKLDSKKDISDYRELIDKIINYRWLYELLRKEKKEKEALVLEDIIEEIKSLELNLKKFLSENKKDKDYLYYISSSYKKHYYEVSEEKRLENILKNYKDLLKATNFWDGRYLKKVDDKLIEQSNFIKNLLAKYIYNKEVLEYEKNLFKVMQSIYKIYDENKFKDRKFSFADISFYVYIYMFNEEYKIIDENGVTDNFFHIMDMKIDTIFIDEFQDTSILQWKILHEIIKQAKNVICVGDEKQSIYGWRDGEKKLFERLDKILDSKIENMDTSYRSDINIVDYTNEFFNKVNAQNEDWSFTESKAFSKKNGYVEVKSVSQKEDSDDYYLETLVKILKEKFNSNYNDIAIIARKNKILNKVAEYLKINNIPYNLSSERDIKETRAIKELIYLLAYLQDDKYLSLLEFLASKIVNISKNDIKNLAKYKKNILEFLNNREKNIDIEKLAFTNRENVLINLNKIKDIKYKFKAYKFENAKIVDDILRGFPFMTIYNQKEDVANIFHISKLIKEKKNIASFLDYISSPEFEYAFPLEDTEDKINLITIHKSKGLQYSTVFYLDLSQKKNNQNKNIFYFCMDEAFQKIEDSLLTSTKYTKVIDLAHQGKSYREYTKKVEEEEINNLYVAITRAKNNLFILYDEKIEYFHEHIQGEILASIPKEQKDNFIDDLKNISNEKITILDTAEDEDVVENESLINDEYLDSKFTIETEFKRVKGLLVHYFLENLLDDSQDSINFSISLTYKKFSSNLSDKTIKNILLESNIKKIIEDNSFLFDKKWAHVYNEFPIFDEEEKKLYRIDRLMLAMKDGFLDEILIVDYKTGSYGEEQLKNYKRLIAEKYNIDDLEKIKTKYIEIRIN